jgi:undecaprenyl-diphosphatase
MIGMHELVIIIAQYCIAIPVVAYLYVLFSLKTPARKVFIVQSLIAVLITAVFVKLAAHIHQDPRPFVRDGVHPYFGHSTDNGFPSDHTTFSALIAFLVMSRSKWIGIGLVFVAFLIGAARVIAGVHHGQDIIAGFVVGAAGFALSVRLVGYLETWYRARKTV